MPSTSSRFRSVALSTAVASLSLLASPAFATTIKDPAFFPLGTDATVPVVIGRIVRAILSLVGLIALVMFVYGGLTWMTSAGNEERVAKAKRTLTWSAIGIIVTLGAATLVNFVLKALGA